MIVLLLIIIYAAPVATGLLAYITGSLVGVLTSAGVEALFLTATAAGLIARWRRDVTPDR